MKERFKSYTAQKKKPWHALSGDPREPFESIALCEHLASTPCFNQQIWGCNWSIKERFSLRFLYVLLHKPLSCLNLKTAVFCGEKKKKKVCYGVYLDKSSFILFFGVLWIFMSFDGDGDREEDDVRTLCTYIIPPVFTDAFMQTLKDKKKKNMSCPGGNWTFILPRFDHPPLLSFRTELPVFASSLWFLPFYLPPKFSPSATRYWRSVKI